MKVSVFGCGYLGAVHAACMASLGHDVVGIDVLESQVTALSAGEPPFHEPGFAKMLQETLATGRLRFSTDHTAAADATVHFICVGTPQRKGENAADVSYVDAAMANLLEVVKAGDLVVGKSTVPVGTAERLAELRKRSARGSADVEPGVPPRGARGRGHPGARTAWSTASARAMPSAETVGVLDEVYAPMLAAGVPRRVTDIATAELVKTAANSFLATKISFINAMAELCEAAGGDVTELADAIGMDKRIGRSFLNAGLGFGGGCLPKDIRAFMARAGELGADQALSFLREVDAINMRRRVRMVDLARAECGGSIVGRRVAVLGAAFKPHSDDIRDSPALNVAAQMQLQGASVVVTDPKAVPNAARRWPDLRYAATAEEAMQSSELTLVLTEWPEYVDLDPAEAKTWVAVPRVLDGRNCLDPERWRAAGWTYRALGRRDAPPSA